MKVMGINGSPRKNGNTAILLEEALSGAGSLGYETELIHLYDLNFRGCSSCFACKLKNRLLAPGHCGMKDDLTDVLEKILNGDGLILGTPIYLGNISGEMQSFIERLIFPCISYNDGRTSPFRGKINSGFIYTMNMPEDSPMSEAYQRMFLMNQNFLQRLGGASHYMVAGDTYQFGDYSLYEAGMFDEAHKAQVRKEQFPLDRRRAFELGTGLASDGPIG